MRFRYNVYPEIIIKLEKTGLKERIERLVKSEDKSNFYVSLYQNDVINEVKEMMVRGYFKTLPKDIEKQFKQTSNDILRNPEKFSYTIHKKDKIINESADIRDLELMVGWPASFILSPEEIWDYKKFGFSSITDLTGGVGAFIYSRLT